MTSTTTLSLEDCVKADAVDPLREFRREFAIPEGVLYFDGNSLGARPIAAQECAARVIGDEWGNGLVRSWNEAGWFDLPVRLGDKLAPLLGAGKGEVVVTDSTSINLFKALASALSIAAAQDPSRKVIVSERDNFPTDLYIAEGIISLLDQGYELRLIDHPGDLTEAVGPDTAVVMLSHVNYRTGNLYAMTEVTAAVQERGALMIWDLAHSAGAVAVDLGGADADFAVGCTYKYLNGGPGSPAFIWVNRRHQNTGIQPLSGWWGTRDHLRWSRPTNPAQEYGAFSVVLSRSRRCLLSNVVSTSRSKLTWPTFGASRSRWPISSSTSSRSVALPTVWS